MQPMCNAMVLEYLDEYSINQSINQSVVHSFLPFSDDSSPKGIANAQSSKT